MIDNWCCCTQTGQFHTERWKSVYEHKQTHQTRLEVWCLAINHLIYICRLTERFYFLLPLLYLQPFQRFKKKLYKCATAFKFSFLLLLWFSFMTSVYTIIFTRPPSYYFLGCFWLLKLGWITNIVNSMVIRK